MTAVEWLQMKMATSPTQEMVENINVWFAKAKEMDKEQKQRFNKFLNDEMELGISDKKTIERIHWYYNNYLLTFKSE